MKLATPNPTCSTPHPTTRPAPARRWLRTARAAFGLAAPLALATALVPTPGQAQEVISASPDVTISVNGVLANDDDVVVDNQLGLVLLENLGPLPTASDVIALGAETDGDRLIAFDTTTALPGGGVARTGDVVRTDGASYSIVFDASAEGLPFGVATDAVSLAPGGLLLSFDTTVALPGGPVVADEDLVVWDGANFTLVFDGSAEGFDTALDVDGAQALGAGAYLLSFDTSGLVGGIAFADEDLVRFDGTGFALERDMTSLASSWGPADMDAVFVPEPGFAGGLLVCAGLVGLGAMQRRRRTPREERLSPFSVALGLATMAFAAAGGANAADGVMEINQACVQTGCLPGDTGGFPVTINIPGSIRLTSSLVTPNESVTAIVVNAPDVSIDLGGFGLVRTDCAGSSTCPATAGAGYGIRGFVRGLRIHNGSVVGMGADGIAVGDDAIVENLIIRRSGLSGVNADSNTIVRNCVVVDNLEDGIRTFRASVVADNAANGNLRYGLLVDAGSRVSGNTSDGNTLDGIRATASVVVDNAVTGNNRHGIYAVDGSSVARNMVRENTGFALVLTGGSAYRENVISGSPTTPVFSGVNLGSNSCNGTAFCP